MENNGTSKLLFNCKVRNLLLLTSLCCPPIIQDGSSFLSDATKEDKTFQLCNQELNVVLVFRNIIS